MAFNVRQRLLRASGADWVGCVGVSCFVEEERVLM